MKKRISDFGFRIPGDLPRALHFPAEPGFPEIRHPKSEIRFVFYCIIALTALGALDALGALYGATNAPGAKRWWSHVLFLADDKLEGRETGSEGHRRAAEYVAAEFERSGLKPAGISGYVQPVKLTSRRIVEAKSSVALIRNGVRTSLTLGEDCTISMRSEPSGHISAPLIFVGYGLVAPEMKYDDLAGLDLRGKIAVYLVGGPPAITGSLRSHYQSAGERARVWQQAGVAGTVSLPSPRSDDLPWNRTAAARLLPSMNLLDKAAPSRLSITANPAYAAKFLAGSGHTLEELVASSKAGRRLPTFSIPVELEADVEIELGEIKSQNVAAIYPGTDSKLSNEYVVLSAHLDHLGRGKPINGDAIYNGAMDNASGIATLLETAAALHSSAVKLKRSVLFVAVTGEEKGLLGSQFFATHPTIQPDAIVADLNMDMFLPLFPLRLLTAIGAQESDLGDRLRAVAGPLGIAVQDDPEPQRNLFIRSDQYSFIQQGIPSLAFKVGYKLRSPEESIAKKWLAERYHAPSDDVNQPVDLKAATDFNRVLLRLTESVANQTERPKWKESSFFKRFAK